MLLLISFPVLWFNESRDVKHSRFLSKLKSQVKTIDPSEASSHYDCLVHMTSPVSPLPNQYDPEFNINESTLLLERRVEMLQWVEHKSQRKINEGGGRTRVETTYNYDK